jgi:hypothetical protein
MIIKENIIVRLAKKEERFEIVKLLNGLGLKTVDVNNETAVDFQWDRNWDKNVSNEFLNNEIVYGWVLEYDKRIVGFFGTLKRVYTLNGKIIPVAIASQWAVEKEFRTHTYMLSDKFFNAFPDELKLVTTAIKPTGRIFEKYNGTKVPMPELGEVYMIPISLKKLASLKVKNKFVKSIVSLVLSIIPFKLKYAFIREDNNFKQVNIENLPSDLDLFFDKGLKNINGLVAVRNKKIIEWFYKPGVRNLNKKIFVYNQNSITAGFCSIMYEPIEEDKSINRYKIIDVVAADAAVKQKMILQLIKFAYNNNIDIIEIHHAGLISKDDIKCFYLKRTYSNFPFFYQTNDENLKQLLSVKSCWNIMPFDGDTSLG